MGQAKTFMEVLETGQIQAETYAEIHDTDQVYSNGISSACYDDYCRVCALL